MRRRGKPPSAPFGGIIRASLRPSYRAKTNKTMKQFLLEILKQLIGKDLRKTGLIITYYANIQRDDLGLDTNTIEDVFMTGRKVESKIKSYGKYSISVSYRWDENNKKYIVTSIRKFENQEKPLNKDPRWERRWK